MSSPEKIEANRQNAQHSTGPTTPAGLKRCSLNATRHGFTGQTLVLSPEENEAYHAHVRSYFDHYAPFDAPTKQLTQQLADAHWSIHQIFVQQSNIVALINSATQQLIEAGDALATATALAPLTKTLQTYTIYEQRRRRAVADIETRLEALLREHIEHLKKEIPQAAQIYKLQKAKGKTWDPADSGFVCSLHDVEAFLEGQTMAAEFQNLQNSSNFQSAPKFPE
jgi:hypothetical protein